MKQEKGKQNTECLKVEMEEAEKKKVCVSGQRVKTKIRGVGNKEASGRRRKGNWNDEDTV